MQNFLFHVKDLLTGEFVLTHLQELVEVWRVDLLVLRGDPESRHANQVQLILLDLLLAHKLVYDENSDIECFWEKAEFTVDVNDPLDQEGSGCVLDFGLDFLEIFMVDHALVLLFDHVLVDFLGELRHILRITEV